MFTTKKIALVSVINDLVTDHRVNKTCLALVECDYNVVLIGRKLPESPPIPIWPFKCVRMNLLFKRGPLFYLFFNLRLFVRLLFSKSDLLFSNDLDTLLPNYLVSRLKRIPLVYDSHELFTEVPELLNSSFKRNLWKRLERIIIPQLKHCITVNNSIAQILEKEYGTKFNVVRNIPNSPSDFPFKSKKDLGLPPDKKIILLQGNGINVDRGAEEVVEAMRQLENCVLLVIGGGDVWPILQEKVKGDLSKKVILINRIPKSELIHYTRLADLGLSVDKNTNLNYYYSLPNKLFDYIHAGIPVLASRLPEIENIINKYEIGDFLPDHDPAHIAAKITQMLSSPMLAAYKNNTARARLDLNWKTEKEKLLTLLQSL